MTDATGTVRDFDVDRAYAVLICDLVGLRFGPDGKPDCSEVRDHIELKGGRFHMGPLVDFAGLDVGYVHFFYQPDLSTRDELVATAGSDRYDAVIAAATFLPEETVFPLGGVRIGAGTGNMGSASWGGGSGEGGVAPLMNTPGINSRATAQMAMKAILKVFPDIDVELLNGRVRDGDFDTGRELKDFPTEKLEGKTMAIIGYGNIGRELAKLARAFGMNVRIHAREHHREWIEAEGFLYAATPVEAAKDADALSVHVGLGSIDAVTGGYANTGLVDAAVLSAMKIGSVLVNYDRGELVDVVALEDALTSGRIRHAAIDADLFKNTETGTLSGPMKPYLALVEKHRDKLELLPHAAADTDHPSRVAGGKQAVDQIMDAIFLRLVTNLKGSLPSGYQSGGTKTPPGIGPVTSDALLRLADDRARISQLAEMAAVQAAMWRALTNAGSEAERRAVVGARGKELLKSVNLYTTRLEDLCMKGPYQG